MQCSSYTGELSTPEEWSRPAKMVAKFPLSKILPVLPLSISLNFPDIKSGLFIVLPTPPLISFILQTLSVPRATSCLQPTTFRPDSFAPARSSMSSPCSMFTGEYHLSLLLLRKQFPLLVLCPQVNFSSCPINLCSPLLVLRKFTESPVHSCNGSLRRTPTWQRRLLRCLFYIFVQYLFLAFSDIQIMRYIFLRWRVCLFPPDCLTPRTSPPTSTRSTMTTIVNMETLPLPWRFRWKQHLGWIVICWR